MKKVLIILYLMVFSMSLSRAQCVPTCSNYVMTAINFTTFTNAGTDIIPMVSPSIDDGITPPLPIGFNFNFYCNTYNQVLICTNGFLQFNIGSPPNLAFSNPAQLFPDPASPNGMVALNMCDFDPNQGGTITYTTIGTSPNQKFILTYSNVPMWSCSTVVNTGQIVLYETSNIIEIYTGDINSTFGSCYAGTQGIEDPNGIMGIAVPGRNQSFWGGTNSAYQFAPFSPAPLSAITGPTNICQGTQNSYQISSQAGATYTWSYPAGWTGPYNGAAVTTTGGASGNLSVTASYTCGTSAPAVLTISVTPSPVVTIVSTNPQILCSGNTFTMVPAGADTYTLLPDAISSPTPFVITPSVTKTYTLTGTSNNCNSFNLATSAVLVNPSPTVTVLSGSICQGQTFSMSPFGALNYNITGGFPNVSPGAPGTYSYSVTGIAANGCSNAVPVISSLTVSPNPTLNVVADRTNLCKGEVSILTASVADTYSWNTGPTTHTLAVSPTLIGTSGYTVTGTTTVGCSKSRSINISVFACTGMEETIAGGTGLRVYPNPSGGTLHLEFDNIHQNANFYLYDSTGRLVLEHATTVRELWIDVTNHASGLYYLRVRNGDAFETVKIIKE